MPKEGKKIRVHDESINTYGFRVKTDGWMNREQFEANPIMLYNHNQPWKGDKSEILPIGYWKDLAVVGDEIHGTPVFDVEDDDFAKTIAGKYERNVLRSASIGIRIMATSDDPADMAQGQTRPTVTKWELREISIVDIPANKNAVVLYDADNNMVNLSDDGGGLLPIIKNQKSTIKMEKDQNLQFVAGFLGLTSGATLADVQDGIANLRQKNNDLTLENTKLKAENKSFKDAENALKTEEAKTLLDQALNDGRITNESRPMWEQNFSDNHDNAKRLLSLMQGKIKKLSDVPNTPGSNATPVVMNYQGKTYKELDKENPALLAQLKENDFETFKALFKASYGTEWKEEV